MGWWHAARPPEPAGPHGWRYPSPNRGVLTRASRCDGSPEPLAILTPRNSWPGTPERRCAWQRCGAARGRSWTARASVGGRSRAPRAVARARSRSPPALQTTESARTAASTMARDGMVACRPPCGTSGPPRLATRRPQPRRPHSSIPPRWQPRTDGDPHAAQQRAVRARATRLARTDPNAASERPSQPPLSRCCDDHLNAPSTLAAKRRALERRLADILEAPTRCDLAHNLQRKFRRARDQLLTFEAFPGSVEVTNDACERALRPAVVQRKVTNGYRAMWAAEGEAAIRTVVDTARLASRTSPFSTILKTVDA